MDFARALVRAPDVADAAHYRRRVTWLCIIFPTLFCLAAVGLVLVVWRGRLFVTLAQRSNVETLTIAFVLFFFAYILSLTAKGAFGGLRVALYHLRAWLARDADAVERAKIAALGKPGDGPACAINRVIERADRPGEPLVLAVRDRFGSMGSMRIDGVRIDHVEAHRDGSNNIFPFVVRQIAEVTGTPPEELTVLEWRAVDDKSFHEYVASVTATRNLGRRLGDDAVWPRIALTAQQCDELERRLADVCDALRDEAFLPHWEFEGEHKVPIIPEPLGVISLKRSERRVDPLSSMLSALVVVAFAVALIAWFMWRPPWVPAR